MKKSLLTGTILAAGILLVVLLQKGPPIDTGEMHVPPPQPELKTGPGETVAIYDDKEQVFRRAFWRHPSPTDVIHRVERREWTDAGDDHILRWQWFIQVTPSPDLLRTLQDQDTFGLVKTTSPRDWSVDAAAPAWFPLSAAGCDIHQAPSGGMTLIYQPDKNLLFATDEGHGLAPPKIEDE